MRVFVASATGAIGRRLVSLLLQTGHSVTGMTRSETGTSALRSAGATAAVADALDANAVENAIKRAQPETIIHELTAIPAALDFRKFCGAICGDKFASHERNGPSAGGRRASGSAA